MPKRIRTESLREVISQKKNTSCAEVWEREGEVTRPEPEGTGKKRDTTDALRNERGHTASEAAAADTPGKIDPRIDAFKSQQAR